MIEPLCVRAANPGPMTLDGTNTWVIAAPEEPALVIDPGPDTDEHRENILRACVDGIDQVWLTHHHPDHSEMARGLAEATGAVVRALDYRLSTAEPLHDAHAYRVGACTLEVVWIPGHTTDSVGILLTGSDTGPEFFTGDMVLGEGTTVIAHPDGDLADYFGSLDKMQRLVAERGVRRFLPGHGQIIDDPATKLAEYRTHREERLDQVQAVLDTGITDVEQVVERIYGQLTGKLRWAAERSAMAQIDFLTKNPRTPKDRGH